jgi:hypothetical protein
MHYEDAIRFLIERLAANRNIFVDGNRPPNFDIFIPNVITIFLREQNPQDARLFNNPESFRLPDFDDVWLAFYDAAWDLCRRGIFRLGEISAQAQGAPRYTIADGYSITAAGRDWIRSATAQYLPTAPGRYVEVLRMPAIVLGGGFLQRAAEAAGCHSSGNYLACCAMCGAAAEATLLAIATGRTDNRELVLNKYEQSGGREKVTRLIFGQPGSSLLERRFRTGLQLLAYWRDEAAHGRESAIEELEAYDAMGRLLYLARLAWDNWTELTGKPRPE